MQMRVVSKLADVSANYPVPGTGKVAAATRAKRSENAKVGNGKMQKWVESGKLRVASRSRMGSLTTRQGEPEQFMHFALGRVKVRKRIGKKEKMQQKNQQTNIL